MISAVCPSASGLVRPSMSPTTKKRKKPMEKMRPTKPGIHRVIDASCHSPLHQSQFSSILLSSTFTITRDRKDGSEEVVKEGWSSSCPSPADSRQDIGLSSASSQIIAVTML